VEDKKNYAGELILAPPMAKVPPWMKRFYPYKTALASGWMQVRGTRRRKNLDRGFALSDHADWEGLLATVNDTKASLILTTHGNASTLARYLSENNKKAFPLHGTEWIEEGE
jgi:putative mRNA 3-end processing factor